VTLSTSSVERTSISAAEIHVWHAQLDRDVCPPADRLPLEERERAARLNRPLAQRRWVAARWALREVLGRYLDEDPAAVELRIAEQGKPMLAAPSSSLRFNLSHSGGRALVAVTWEREVGVDIEQVRPRGDLLALARRALEPAEADAIVEMSPEARPAAFHAAWTRREAVAKCLGTGLAAPLPEGVVVAVSALNAGPGFAAAIAVSGTGLPPPRHFVI